MANALVTALLVVLAICHNTYAAHGVVAAAAGSKAPAAAAAAAAALPSAAREFLEAHNGARAAVGVGALKWSEQLANASNRVVSYQRYKMGCQFANLTDNKYKYGANQLWVGGGAVTPRMAVEEWVKEKKYYNYGSNTCAPNHKCGVYTQVVWKNSSEVGCAQATCKDKAMTTTTLTLCFYNPPGNYVGERPY